MFLMRGPYMTHWTRGEVSVSNQFPRRRAQHDAFAIHCFISCEKAQKQLKTAFACSNTYADTLAWQLNISYIVSQRIKSPLGRKEEFSV